MTISNEILKRDSAGRLRTWQYETDVAKYRTIAGLLHGSSITSSWTDCVGKQGRSDAEQAEFEGRALYDQKLDREYRLTEAELSSVPTSPMLAQDYKKQKCVLFPIYSQPKLDGIRSKTTRAGAFSREFQRHLNVDHILEALAPIFAKNPNLEFDGELYNHDLRDDFGKIASIVRKQKPTEEHRAEARRVMQYHIYDLPSCKGDFGERTTELATLFKQIGEHPSLVRVQTSLVDTKEELDAVYGSYLEDGYEGQMVRLDEPYDFDKRSKFLLKRKEFITAEFPVTAIFEGTGNWAGYAKMFEFMLPDDKRMDNGERPKATIKGNMEQGTRLLKEFPTWGPKKQITVRYFKPIKGIPRFPVCTDFHPNGRID